MSTSHLLTPGAVHGSLTVTDERVALLPAKNGFARVCLCSCGVATCIAESYLTGHPRSCGHPHASNTRYVTWDSTGEVMTLAAAIQRAGLNNFTTRRDIKRGATGPEVSNGAFHLFAV